MTSARCPHCSGLVRPDDEWCGQCLTRLDRSPSGPEPQPDRPAGPPTSRAPSRAAGPRPVDTGAASHRGVRATADGIVWTCPTCDSENPIEATACRTCGTPFGRLLEEPAPRVRVASGRAVAFSLLFPGLGHLVAGRGAEGLARAVIFGYALATAVTILVATGGRPGPFLSLAVASVLVAAAVYALSAVDAGRSAGGQAPVLSSRVLLYGGAALILLTVVELVVVGIRASGAAR